MKPFTIVANNCWSNKVYEHLGVPYQTPLTSTFLHPEDYLAIARNFRWYIDQSIEFIDKSRHEVIRSRKAANYPIGIVAGEVEIHFLHYETQDEVIQKWKRRASRVVEDDDRLFFKLCDDLGCTEEHIEQFHLLPFKNKICYTSKPYPYLKHALHIKGKGDCVSFEDASNYRYFDAPKWVTE